MLHIVDCKIEWDKYYRSFSRDKRDVYFTYEYCSAFQENGDGALKAVFFQGENGTRVFYPFILKKITGYKCNKEYFDIESVYGYGGPLVENYCSMDMARFEEQFHLWCLENNIVAEFIRFHPLLANHQYFNRNISIEENRKTVFVDLTRGFDDIFMKSISSKGRNMIRKAEKSGVVVKPSNSYGEFVRLYKNTMAKLDASPYFYFSAPFYKRMFEMDGQSLFILTAEIDGKVIAAAMFIYDRELIHYHLAGSDEKYMAYAPNNLLICKAIAYGCEMGLKKMHLGGGITDSEDDSLYKFKASFSKERSCFYIGKRIHNLEAYNYFINEWKKITCQEPRMFLQYQYLGN